MIERIQEIKNVGTFSNTNPASIGLTNLVFIYGQNSQGKTTFCDIFKSLMLNNVEYIKERKTIGGTGKQNICFNLGNKKEIKFDDNKWIVDKSIFDINNIQVFDTEFVYNNVFTNSQIEHKNKENFTKFVIGDESVKLSQELYKLNENKKLIENQIDDLKNLITKKINDQISLADFLLIPYKEDVTIEDCQCLALQTSIAEENKNKNDIDTIKKMEFPKVANSIDFDFIEKYTAINEILVKSMSFEKDDMLKAFYLHKEKCMKNNTEVNIDKWLMQGVSIIKEKCPFCGSDISENQIIETYIKFFSEEMLSYNESIEKLKSRLDKQVLSLPVEILKNETLSLNINQKIYDKNINELFNELNKKKDILISKLDTINKILSRIHTDMCKKIELKLNSIYSSVEQVNIEDLIKISEEININIDDYNSCIKEFVAKSRVYIENLSKDTIDKHISEMSKEFNYNKNIVLRNQLNTEIISLNEKKLQLEENILLTKQKKKDFDKTQEEYLKSFYDDINYYFEQFGSRNYKIEKSITTRGTNKTYSLDLNYRGNKISPEKIQFVLSESDRRALALSIFFTKLKNISNKNMIIVLDDPITSFDLERINVFINKLKEIGKKVGQVFVTTHYQNFFKKLVSLTRNDNPTLIKIKQEPKSNKLIKVDAENETLLMDEYEHALFEMTTFMSGASHVYSAVAARTILQKCLEYHFSYELLNVKYNNLSELTKYLLDNNLIEESLYDKLENKRIEYNDPAHEFDLDDEEQKRNSIMELYGILQEI